MSSKTHKYFTHKRFSTYSYIENEFFNADKETFKKIIDLYYELYGFGPYKYLLNTYQAWKSHSVSTSRRTMNRIFECVPRFLSDKKRFHILKNEVIYFIEDFHQKQQNKNIKLNELNDLFESYATHINSFSQANMPYMVGKRIFTTEEIEQFLCVCKYSLLEKLNLSYSQVQNDLNLFKDKISTFKTGIFIAYYQIDFLNSIVDISNINETNLVFKQLNETNINLSGRYKEFSENYILEELMQMSFLEKEGVVNHYVKSSDLDFFLNQYHHISRRENEATLKSDFKGEGGELNVVLEVKSLSKIKYLLFLSGVKTIIYLGIPFLTFYFTLEFELYKLGALLIFGSLFFGVFLLEGLKSEIRKIKSLKLDLRVYGQ